MTCTGEACRQRLFVLALLVAPAAPAAVLELEPAWGGRFVPGQPTEVRIGLTAEAGGAALVRLIGAAGRVTYATQVEAGQLGRFSLPAYPGPDGRLTVQVDLPEGAAASGSLDLVPEPGRFTAHVSHPAATASEVPAVVEIPAADLPRHPAGYGPVGSLAVPAPALGQPDPAQAAALAAFLAACRPLWLVGAGDAVLARVRAAAGCAGRYVDRLPEQGPHRTPAAPAPLPPPGTLAERIADPATARLSLLLLPYPILLLGLAALRRPGAWLLLAPAAGTLAYAWLLPSVMPAVGTVTWAEMNAGDPAYRFVTLLETRGGGGAQAPLYLPAVAGLPRVLGREPLEIALSAELANLALPLPGRLLATRRYLLEGTRTAPVQVEIVRDDGAVDLRNGGTAAVPAGWLLWRGGAFPTPALGPGAEHRVSADDRPAEPPPDLPAFALRRDEPALLLALADPLGPGGDPRIRASGRLLVRGSEGRP